MQVARHPSPRIIRTFGTDMKVLPVLVCLAIATDTLVAMTPAEIASRLAAAPSYESVYDQQATASLLAALLPIANNSPADVREQGPTGSGRRSLERRVGRTPDWMG